MNALLAVLALALSIGIAFFVPVDGAGAVLLCAVTAAVAALLISRMTVDREFLLRIFAAALIARMAVGTLIYLFQMQEFFGGDAGTYNSMGYLLTEFWRGVVSNATYNSELGPFLVRNWGMIYLVAAIYEVIGPNMLAVQFFNAVLGAATVPIIYLCARHIFQSSRVARIAAFFVAFYPSLVLWSSQGLKDGPIVFLLALVMLATLKLGERFDVKFLVVLGGALFCIMSLRFYIFYMTVMAILGAFVIGMRPQTTRSLARQLIIIVVLGLALTYVGVLRSAETQFEYYGDLGRVQNSRNDLSRAQSGFGGDVDVSTTGGAIKIIPVGMLYLLFAPFPWQLGNLRQSITLPEMIVWWASFPLLVIGVWFTLKYRLRQSLPILIFTAMLTLAYSIFQGNVGTAYRQRSQLLVFYFIFVAVGFVLLRERKEDRRLIAQQEKQAALAAYRPAPASYRASPKALNTGG